MLPELSTDGVCVFVAGGGLPEEVEDEELEVVDVAVADAVEECAVKTALRSEGAGADHVSTVGSLQLTLKEASTLQHAHSSVDESYTISGYP